MTVPAWPATLPQELVLEGYSGAFPDNRLASDMDAGPAKVRRRATSAIEPVIGLIFLNATQLGIFETFYNDTLLGGSLRFSWTRPPAHTAAVEMRFLEPPVWTAEAPQTYKASMELEMLP